MRQLKLFLTLLTLMCFGIGQMWGAELTYTHDFTTTFSNGDQTLSTITWTASSCTQVSSFNSQNYQGVQFGTKKNEGGFTLTSKYNWGAQTNTDYYGYTNVKKVYVWLNKGGGTTTASVTVGGTAATSDGTTVEKNSNATSQRNGTTKITFTPASGHNTGAIVISCSATGGAAGYICSIQVECEEPASSCSAPTSPNITGTTSYTAGQNILLTASATGTDASTTYQWYNGDPDNGGTSQGEASTSGATFTKNNCVVGDAGTYYCVISNGTGCTAKVSKTITVAAASVPSITPSETELDWGTVNKGTILNTKTFTITGSNLTSADLVYTANGGYSVSPEGKDGAAGALALQTLTVTPPSTETPGTYNSTVTITGGGLSSAVSVDVKLTVQNTDQFIDELHGTTGYTSANPHVEAGSYGTTPSIADKTVATSGTCAEQHYHFAGWITAAKYEAGTTIAAGDLQSPTTATGATYYAVWAKQGEGGGSFDGTTEGAYKIYATSGNSNYYALNTIKSSSLNTTTDAAEAQEYTFAKSGNYWTISYQDGNTTKYLTASSSANISAFSTNTGDYTSWKIESQGNGVWRLWSASTNNSGQKAYEYRALMLNSSNKFKNYCPSDDYTDCKIVGSASWVDYRAVCCTPLDAINGSVSMSQTSATLTWDNLDHVAASNPYAVTYRTGENAFGGENVGQITTNNQGKMTCTITGLDCGTEYDFKIAVTAASGYCDKDSVMENKSTSKWNITYNLTNTVSLSEGPEEGANACGEISATFSKGTSYTFPETITVKIGGVTKTAGTDYTWNSTTGVLSIEAAKVTGDIAITIAGVAPANPVVTPNPTALSFDQVKKGADVPTAKDIAITGNNLTAALTVTSSDETLYVVSVKSGSLTPDDKKDASPVITVTPQEGITATAGDKNATITISGGGLAEAVVVNVTFNVQETYTVNWYVNGTDNAHKERMQTDIVGTDLTEIPSDFTGVMDCSDKVFMGWTEDDDYTHATDAPADLITSTTGMKITAANKNYYAVFADKEGEDSNSWDLVTDASSLQENDIITFTSTCEYTASKVTYKDTVAYAGKSGDLGAVVPIGITNNKIRTVKEGSIREIKLEAGSTDGTWKLYDLTDKYLTEGDKKITYAETSGDVSISITSGAATVKFGTSSYSLQYNPNNNAGTYSSARMAFYSSAQKGIQIYKKTVTSATYSNYVTVCPHVSRVTLSAAYGTTPANGEITFAKGGSAITSIATDGENPVTVDVVPDPETGYELTGVVLTSEDVNVGQGGASYSNGVITIPANEEGTLTATATFAQKNYSIAVETYPENISGISLGGATSEAKYGVEQTISTNEPTGYLFGGWYMFDASTFDAEDIDWSADLSSEIFTGTYEGGDYEMSASFLMPDKNLVAVSYFDKIYTPAEALALDDLTDSVYVEGIISQVDEVSTQYKNATYWISADGTTTNQIKIYRGKHINKADVTVDNAAQIAVGNKVRVRGKLSQSSNVNQFGQGASYITVLVEKTLSALTIVGDASVTTYDVGDSFDKTGLSLSATYNTGYVQANYTGTTITSNYDAPTTFTAGVTSVTVSAEEGIISTSRDIEVTVSSAVLDHVVISADAQTEFWAKEQYKEPLLDAYLTDEPATVLHNVTGVSNTTGLDMSEPEDKSVIVTYTRKAGQEADVEYNFTVKPVVVDEAHAHSVATAREIIDVDKTDGEDLDLELAATKTHVVGVVTSVSALTGANAGKYTIVIKDQADADKVMTLYQVTLKSGITSVAQNDIIKAYGNLYYHSQSSKYEINTDGEVVAVVRTPNLTVADVAEMEVNITADLAEADLTINKDGSNGAITFSCSDAAVTIVNNQLHAAAAGDATVTATIAADGIYTAASTTFSVHVIAERTRYAITMDKNGGSGVDPVYDNQLAGATVDMPAVCLYNYDGHGFTGWKVINLSTEAEIEVENDQFEMPAANVKIQAQWAVVATCRISFQVSGSEVATADAPQTAEFSLAGVSHPTIEGFTWIGWSETEYDDETTTLPTTITSYTPALNQESKTLYGIYSQVVGGASNKHYVLDYAEENLGSNTNWGEYTTAYDYTAADAGEWIIKAYKSSGMQINTGKSAYIKVPECAAKIIQISLTCNSSAKKAVKFAETTSGDALAIGTESISQTLDLSSESVTTGYILPTGNCQITHIDVEYSGNVTYYTSSPVTRYTITYAKGDATGVSGLCETQRKAAGSITLCDAPTCDDKVFAKWSDGTNLYAAGASYTLSADVTFTATWTDKPKYTVTYTANGGTGTAPAVEEYMEGETVTVKENEYFTKPGFDYDGWLIVYNNGVSDQEITPENGEFEMVSYNVTIKAKWAEESKQKWALVTDVEDLKAGDKYIIAAAGYNVAMAGQNENNRAETAVVKRNEGAQLKGTSSMQVITLEGTTGAWEFNTGAGYLYAASSSKNYLRTQETNDYEGKWTISITEAGVATITATGTNTNNQLKYNSGSKIFSCYGSGQAGVALYKEIPMTVINDNVSDQDDVPDGGDMTIGEDKTWTVTEDKEVGDLYMEEGAIIANNDGENSAMVEADDLYFKAKTGKSNQIFDLSKITVVGSLYYDFQLCDGDVDANYWYSISVPFDVNLNDGVYQVGGTTPLVNHTDFEVWGYNTNKRAQTQSNGWERVTDNKMHAGKAYLIGFNPGQPNIIRLKAAADWKTNLFSGSSMSVVSTSGSGDHDNWNGLANPTGRYIDVNTKTSVFNNDTHNWDSYDPATYAFNFVVGTAFFVQSASAVTISNTDHGNYRAPQREGNELAYAVRISKADATRFDNQIIVRASEDATNSYEQGHDMLTMNNATSNTSAMLWTVNYGGKRLAIEEAPLVNDQAIYSLSIFAPAAGTYVLSAVSKADATLYVTYNGAIVWNLSLGDYEIDLARGTTTGYGLMLVAQPNQMPTGVDAGEGVGGDAVQKILLNGQLYILRDGHLFDAVGKEVK